MVEGAVDERDQKESNRVAYSLAHGHGRRVKEANHISSKRQQISC